MLARQLRFIEEYPKDCNSTQAAIRAGYRSHTAKVQGARLLAKPEIANAIQAKLGALAQKAGIDSEWIRAQLRENLERAMQARPVLDEDGKVTGVYKYSGNVANKCLELLGRDLGMFGHRLEISLAPEVQSLIKDLALLAVTYCAVSKRMDFVSALNQIEMRYLGTLPQVQEAFSPVRAELPDEIIAYVLGIALEDVPERALICEAKGVEHGE